MHFLFLVLVSVHKNDTYYNHTNKLKYTDPECKNYIIKLIKKYYHSVTPKFPKMIFERILHVPVIMHNWLVTKSKQLTK